MNDIIKACDSVENAFANAENCAYDNECYVDCQYAPTEAVHEHARRLARTLKAVLETAQKCIVVERKDLGDYAEGMADASRAFLDVARAAWEGEDVNK